MNANGSSAVVLALLSCGAAACERKECPPAMAPAATASAPDCKALGGDNAVQREMRMLECTLQRAVAAIGRDDLRAVPPAIAVLHEAKTATEEALRSGAYKPINGEVASFVAFDEAFHASLVTLVQATRANDPAATAAAMGTVLGGCHGCHAVFRPTAPPPSAAPPAGHPH